MILRERVAEYLRRLRHATDLSQEELADRADVDRNYVGMLELEEHAATIDMLGKLSAVLEVDLAEFSAKTPDRSEHGDAPRASRDAFAHSPASR